MGEHSPSSAYVSHNTKSRKGRWGEDVLQLAQRPHCHGILEERVQRNTGTQREDLGGIGDTFESDKRDFLILEICFGIFRWGH